MCRTTFDLNARIENETNNLIEIMLLTQQLISKNFNFYEISKYFERNFLQIKSMTLSSITNHPPDISQQSLITQKYFFTKEKCFAFQQNKQKNVERKKSILIDCKFNLSFSTASITS